MKYKIIIAMFCVLGLACLFECFSPKNKAFAVYEDGDFSPYTPLELFNRADELYFQSRSEHLNPNSYYIVKDTTWSNNRVNYTIYSFQDDVTTVTFNADIPTTNDTVYSTDSYKVASVQTSIESIFNQPPINELSYSSIYYYSNAAVQMGMKKWRIDYYYSPNVTLVFNNGTINPTVSYDASYYIGASGFNVQVAAYPNENSIYNGWWVETIDYKVQFQITYNNLPIICYPSGYKYYVMDILRTPAASTPSFLRENPYFNLDNRYHTIEYKVSDYGWLDTEHTVYIQSLTTPLIEYENTWYNPEEEFQTIPLSDLLLYLQKDYPDMTFADLQQDITVSFVGADDNHTYYSNILRYSQVDFPDEAPPRDPEAPNWFGDLEDLVAQMNVNKTYNYLSNLPAGYSPIRKVGSLGELDTISRPDFEYHEFEPDENALDFFTWLVNLLFQSPFGLCFTICLGFLVVEAVLHND